MERRTRHIVIITKKKWALIKCTPILFGKMCDLVRMSFLYI